MSDPTLAGSFSLNNMLSQKVGKKKGKKKSKVVKVTGMFMNSLAFISFQEHSRIVPLPPLKLGYDHVTYFG